MLRIILRRLRVHALLLSAGALCATTAQAQESSAALSSTAVPVEQRESIPNVVDWSVMVQLFSLNSEEAAQEGWQRLQKKYPDLLGGMELHIQEIDLGDRGLFYRAQAIPFPNYATAVDLCAQLKAHQQDCLVVRR